MWRLSQIARYGVVAPPRSGVGVSSRAMTTDDLSSSASTVQSTLRRLGVDAVVRELPASTRTAKEAARAIGCSVAQIAKSIVFRQGSSGEPVLVVACGTNRISERLVGAALGTPIEKADAEYVRARTGFAIGGVPPVGHDREITTLLDEDLFGHTVIWAAAGTPHAVVRLTPDELRRASGGEVMRVAEPSPS